jgi:hypothetical protein
MNSTSGIVAGRRLVFLPAVLVLASVLLGGSGCADKNTPPAGIFPREKMESVLWDMIQADQYSTLYLAKDSARIDRKTENLRLYEEVFRLHQVSRDEFRKSYQYYLDHPVLNQILFDSLTVRGNRLRTESYSRPVPLHPPPTQIHPPSYQPHSGTNHLHPGPNQFHSGPNQLHPAPTQIHPPAMPSASPRLQGLPATVPGAKTKKDTGGKHS